MRGTVWLALAGAALLVAGCGILTAPLSLTAAVARNSNFSFKGRVVDGAGQPLDGVIVRLSNMHHLWTPIAGSKDVPDVITRRADGKFGFDARGTDCEFTFSKDGYQDATYRFSAASPEEVASNAGTWRNNDNFPVVLVTSRTPSAPLVALDERVSYENYPVADAISLPNLATRGSNGDVKYLGKSAEDPTTFPAGTLYLTLDKAPPAALNAKGDIDLAELDVPHHVTLHLPGEGSGFVRIEPQVGFAPMKTSDTAPETGYVHDLTFTRARLKEMRSAESGLVVEAHEYFFFRAGHFYGKGIFSWGTNGGPPKFEYELYVQPEADNRDLSSHGLDK